MVKKPNFDNRQEILGICIHVKNFELRNPKTPPGEGLTSKKVFEEDTPTTVIQMIIPYFEKLQFFIDLVHLGYQIIKPCFLTARAR